MLETKNKCIICDNEFVLDTIEIKDYSISKEIFRLSECKNCMLLHITNPPNENKIGDYYKSEDYISHSDTKKGIINTLYHYVREFMLKRKHYVIKKNSSGKKLLDIGCGTGYFLNYMKDKDYETIGLEIDKKSREFGRENFSLDILDLDIFRKNKLEKKFDIITMWHVLEHTYNPVDYFNKIKKLMTENGTLVVAVPNYKSFDASYYKKKWAAYDVPRHIFHFSPRAIKKLTEKTGLILVKTKILPFDSFYNSLLSEKYKKNPLWFFSGMFIGFLSYIQGLLNSKKASSVIYIIKK